MSIFKLIIPFCEYKKGNLFDSFDGLVKGICSEKTNQNINFDNKEYFVMISNTTEIISSLAKLYNGDDVNIDDCIHNGKKKFKQELKLK